MSARKKIEKDIDGHKSQIQELKKQIRSLTADVAKEETALEALEKALKYIPKEDEEEKPAQLRPGSDMARARDKIMEAERPLHIMELLDALGKERNKKNKLSVAGSISSYVRKNQYFTRPEPNTFGVVEFENGQIKTNQGVKEYEGPEIMLR